MPIQSVQDQLLAQRRRSESLGYIPGPTQTEVPVQFGYKVNVVPANSAYVVNVAGDYFFLLNAVNSNGESLNASEVAIKDNNGNVMPLDQIQKGYYFGRRFEYIQILNAGGLPLTIQYYVGVGRIEQQSSDMRVSPIADWVAASFQRPNDVLAYAANQILSTTAAGDPLVFTPIGSYTGNGGQIVKAKLRINNTLTVANSNFTLWLFNADPGNFADKATFAPASVDIDALQGIINFPAQVTGGAGSTATVCTVDAVQIRYRTLTNRTLWGLLVAQAAYVPAANSNIRVELYGDQILPSVVNTSVIVQN